MQLITKTPTVQIVTATREIVDALIALDIHNRQKRKSHIEYLKNDICTGNWHLTNQGIGTTVSGWLCDGGHRLQSIKEAGYPSVQFVLVTGLADAAQSRVDQHAKRNMADTIALLLDVRLTTRMVSMLRTIWQARHRFGKAKKEPIQDIADLACEFSESMNELGKLADLEAARSAMSAAFIEYYHYSLGKEEVAAWISQIIRGTELKENSPEFVANRLMQAATRFSGGGRQAQTEIYCKTIACCERHFKKEKMSKVFGQKYWTVFKVPYVGDATSLLDAA